MKIRTIAMSKENCALYVSDKLWRKPAFAIADNRLTYVGQLGWYPSAEHKALYEMLDEKYQVSEFYPGDYIEVDIEVDINI